MSIQDNLILNLLTQANTDLTTLHTITLNKSSNDLKFNGTTDYLQITHKDDLSLLSDFAISLWVKKSHLAIYNEEVILQKGSATLNTFGVYSEYGNNRLLFQQFDNTSPARFPSNRGSNYPVQLKSTDLNVNQWYHIVTQISGQTSSIYVNGDLNVSETKEGPPLATTDPLYIGGTPSGSNFFGEIRDLRIYNRALTTDEITQLSAMSVISQAEIDALVPKLNIDDPFTPLVKSDVVSTPTQQDSPPTPNGLYQVSPMNNTFSVAVVGDVNPTLLLESVAMSPHNDAIIAAINDGSCVLHIAKQ